MELRYEPEWFWPGIVISVIFLGAFIALAVLFPKGMPTFRDTVKAKIPKGQSEIAEEATVLPEGEETPEAPAEDEPTKEESEGE